MKRDAAFARSRLDPPAPRRCMKCFAELSMADLGDFCSEDCEETYFVDHERRDAGMSH